MFKSRLILINIAIAVLLFCGNCSTSYHIKGRHTTPSYDFAKQQPPRQYEILSFDYPQHHNDTLMVHEIKKTLIELNPNRFGASNDAIPIRISVVYENYSKIKGIGMLPFIFTLGVLPGYQRSETNYAIKIVVIEKDDGAIYDLKGTAEYQEIRGISLFTPLALISGNVKHYKGDAEAKGYGGISGTLITKKHLRDKSQKVYAISTAKEINAMIDKFETTQPAPSTKFVKKALTGNDIKIAIFDPIGNHEIPSSLKNIVREEVSNAVVNTQGFTVLEREQIERVMAENKFQSSGFVNDEQIVEIGRKMGANKVCVINITKFEDVFHISCKLVDVFSARIDSQNTGKTGSGGRDIDKVVAEIVSKMLRK